MSQSCIPRNVGSHGRCSGCGLVRYCKGTQCQKEHWERHHKYVCTFLRMTPLQLRVRSQFLERIILSKTDGSFKADRLKIKNAFWKFLDDCRSCG